MIGFGSCSTLYVLGNFMSLCHNEILHTTIHLLNKQSRRLNDYIPGVVTVTIKRLQVFCPTNRWSNLTCNCHHFLTET